MLQNIEVIESLHVEHLNYTDGYYQIGDIRAKGIVLCAGNSQDFDEIKFCMLKDIYGHRLDVKTSTVLPFHMHKSCSISADKRGIVHIGATHIPGYKYDKIDKYEDKIEELENLAKSYVDFDGFEVKNTHFGVRNSTLDFFPVIGKVVDAQNSLKKYPYIKKGSLVPKEKYLYYPDMYILSGVGARGFVIAPKLASILAQNICTKLQINKELDTQRLFVKYAKKLFI